MDYTFDLKITFEIDDSLHNPTTVRQDIKWVIMEAIKKFDFKVEID